MVESRVPESKDAIRRRRECSDCERRFTTYERVEEMPIVVVKSSGLREPFDRRKLLEGLQRACHKRQVPVAALELAVRDIEAELRNTLKHEVRSSSIGELALRRLKEIDRVAYPFFDWDREAELIAEGHTLHACVDDTGRVSRLPHAVRRLLGT